MYKQIKLQTPSVPNFILTEDLKQPIPIADFTDDELRKIGDEWTQQLISKARGRRYTDYKHVHHEESNLPDRPISNERE